MMHGSDLVMHGSELVVGPGWVRLGSGSELVVGPTRWWVRVCLGPSWSGSDLVWVRLGSRPNVSVYIMNIV